MRADAEEDSRMRKDVLQKLLAAQKKLEEIRLDKEAAARRLVWFSKLELEQMQFRDSLAQQLGCAPQTEAERRAELSDAGQPTQEAAR
jgi:hypothetical protein